MPELVTNCPRCGARDHTFVVKAIVPTVIEYGWKSNYEAFCLCKNCLRSTIFKISQKKHEDKKHFQEIKNLYEYEPSLNRIVEVEGHINPRNMAARSAPEFTPKDIANVYKEGSESVVGNCPNAAAAMFRLCLDLATKSLLPDQDEQNIAKHVREKLKPRLNWLFETGALPKGLENLSDCIREDGNDGAHDGTITNEEAEEIMDFCSILLERLYTEPARLRILSEKRLARREKS